MTPLDRVATHLARGGASTQLLATLKARLSDRTLEELADSLDYVVKTTLPKDQTNPGPCYVYVHVPAQTPKPVRAKESRP